MNGRRAFAVAASLVIVGLLAVLMWEPSSAPLAEVQRAEGRVERDHRGREGVWEPAPVGTQFRQGDAIHTGHGAKATVTIVGSGSLNVAEDTTLRFGGGEPGERRLRIEAGEAEVVAEYSPIRIETAAGLVRFARGSRTRLTETPNGTRLNVRMGSAVLDRPGGGQREITDDVILGAAELEPSVETDAGAAKPALEPAITADDAPPLDQLPAGEAPTEAETPGPDRKAPKRENYAVPALAHLTVAAGTTGVIHDLGRRIAVRVRYPEACAGAEAVVERRLRGRFVERGRGANSAVVWFPRGTNHYRVRCAEDSQTPGALVAKGKLRVLRDAGTRRLPRKAPHNYLEADGRSYRVSYQSRLPSLTLSWPGRPETATAPQLVVESNGKQQVHNAPRGQVRLRSGRVREGKHRFHFRDRQRPDVHSATTNLNIVFDNATPAAYLSGPPRLVASAARGVTMSGVVAPGVSVEASGNPVEVDPAGRFSTELNVGAQDEAVWLRIAHPRLGVHYYVRRVRMQ